VRHLDARGVDVGETQRAPPSAPSAIQRSRVQPDHGTVMAAHRLGDRRASPIIHWQCATIGGAGPELDTGSEQAPAPASHPEKKASQAIEASYSQASGVMRSAAKDAISGNKPCREKQTARLSSPCH